MESDTPAPVRKQPPRVGIVLTAAEFRQLNLLARQMNTSVSALGQLAIRNRLVEWETGRKPSQKVSRLEAENRLYDLLDEVDADPEPGPPKEFKDLKGDFAPMKKGPPEVRIAVTPDEFQRLTQYARHVGKTAAGLGQLALRNMLVQAEAGATPLLPVSLTADGALPGFTMTQRQELEEASQARINMLEAELQLLDLMDLVEGRKPS